MLSLFSQGAIQGPEEFVEGMALGVKALVGGAVGMSKLIYRKYYTCKRPRNLEISELSEHDVRYFVGFNIRF